MLKTRILLLVISVVLIVVLFLLPKIVVENDAPLAEAGDTTAATHQEPAMGDMHAQAPAAVVASIHKLRSAFAIGTEKEKNAIFADSLANLYETAGKFDSSAWFAEEASKFFNTMGSWIKAGDKYYQAYGFAIDRNRQQALAVKAREFYQKVLDQDPTNLEAKTKMGMTYLSDANPMQGIVMLREVLAADPKNELALYNMGMLSLQSGQHEKAVDRMQELIKINPNHIQGHLLLAIALMNTGDKDGARAQFEKVKQLDKDPSVHATVDSYLKDLK